MRENLIKYLSRNPDLGEASDAFQRELEAAGVRLMTFAAVAAGLTALALSVTRLITGVSDGVLAWGPAAVAIIFGWQALSGAKHLGWALLGAAAALVIGFNVTGTSDTLLPAALALVLLGSIGILLQIPRALIFIPSVVGLMVIAGLTWVEDGADRAALLGTMLTGYLVMGFVMWVVRMAGTIAIGRYLRLFEENPVALIEQDWIAAVVAVTELGIDNPETLTDHLLARPELVADLVHKSIYTRVNDAAVQMTGINDRSELLGPMPRERVNETSLEAMVAQIVAICQETERFQTAYETVDYIGEPMWVDVRWIRPPGLRSAKATIVTAIRDITEEVNAREASASLIRAKDEFIASVSHELRTPLTAVVGLSGELESAYEDIAETERIELIELINSQSKEMASIIEDLLVAARVDIGQVSVVPEEISLVENLDLVIREFGWADSIARQDGECRVEADPVRFRQIMRNLIANAHRYGGRGRRITGNRLGEIVEIEVRDDGPGIPAAERERIFEPYARAHSRPGITASVGLGLAVARRLAQLMSGDLTYEYDPASSESVFRLTLPAASSDTP